MSFFDNFSKCYQQGDSAGRQLGFGEWIMMQVMKENVECLEILKEDFLSDGFLYLLFQMEMYLFWIFEVQFCVLRFGLWIKLL